MRGAPVTGILVTAVVVVATSACESGSPLVRSSFERAATVLSVIESCELTAGWDAAELDDCIPEPPPDMTLQMLNWMDARRFFTNGRSSRPGIDAFLRRTASEAQDPVLRGAARYYLAAGLARAVNESWEFWIEPGDRDPMRQGALAAASRRAVAAAHAAARQGALDAATGLSAGVEDEEFVEYGLAGPTVRTFAEAESDLIRRIRHAVVGSTLPDMTGARLDGVEESLSAYRGRVVLLDFWATWCPPCVDALADLRELVAELPADRFALVAISVDEDRETVIELMKDEPMPWTNWHAGISSDMVRTLDVRGYPTYLLIDTDGTILARHNGLQGPFRSLIEATVEGRLTAPARRSG